MAEPNRKQQYDIEPNIRPNLHVVRDGETAPSNNDNSTAQDLSSQERRFGVIQGGGESTPERADLSSVPSQNIDSAKNEEENGNWKNNYSGTNNKDKANGTFTGLKKKGPIGLIIALILGGGTIGFFGTTLLPVAITESFINDTNDVNSSQQSKSLHIFGLKMGGKDSLQKKLSICTAHVSIGCKLNSLNEETTKSFKEKGFSLNDEKVVGGRTVFSSIKFPDGTSVSNVQELTAHLQSSAAAAAAFNSVYSLRNNLFVVGKFMAGVLQKLGVDKSKKVEGKTAEEADKSYDEAIKKPAGEPVTTGATPEEADPNATDAERQAAAANNQSGGEVAQQINEAVSKGAKIKSLALKAGNALLLPQLACLTYNMSRYISDAAKTIKASRFVTFAMIFLSLAGSIKAGTATDAEVHKVTDVLSPSVYPQQVEDENGNMVPNPNIGKNATDAEAYKVVTYGDSIDLTGIARRFFVAGGFLGKLDTIVNWLNTKVGKQKIKGTCKLVTSTAAKIVTFIAAPVFTIALTALTQILPVDQWGAAIVNKLIDVAAGFDLTTGITGVDAGNVLFIGTATVMGSIAMHYGLKPGKLAAVKANIAANDELNQQDIAMARYEAKKTPLAINNRYSFLGSMAYSLANYMPVSGQTFFSSVGKVLSAIPLSLAGFTKNASAAYTMTPAPYSEKRFQQCTDEEYKPLFDPDMFCVPRYVPQAHPVEPDAALDYMLSNKQIDDDGNAIPNSDYSKYIKYCTDRTDPWGSTSVPIESETDSERWYTGEICLDDTVENQVFSEYTGYKISEDNMDEGDSTPIQAFVNSYDPTIANNSSNTSFFGNLLHTIGLQK